MEVLYKIQHQTFSTLFYKDSSEIPPIVYGNTSNNNVGEDVDFLFKDDINRSVQNYLGNSKHPYYIFESSSKTEEDFEKNYGNPLASVETNRMTFVVERNDDKVSVKFYTYQKVRRAGKPYFKKTTACHFITYTFKDNTLYTGRILNSFKKRKNVSSVRKNYFASKPFEVLTYLLHNHYGAFKKWLLLVDSSTNIISDAYKIFFSQIPNMEYKPDELLTYDNAIYKHYLITRGIKYPNNYYSFMCKFPLPNKRLLKKCDNRLVESFMVSKNLRGDKIRKILHNIDGIINDYFYQEVEKFFGEKFLRHQSEEVIESIFKFKHGYQIPGDINTLSDFEKKNAFEVFKENIKKGYSSLQTFIDHINFYITLKGFGENIKWKSNTLSSFNDEHTAWSDIYSQYLEGTYNRKYNEQFVGKVQEVIYGMNLGEYYPVVLTTSYEYNQESSRQSNCVRTYINKPSSFIISLREGSPDSDERATIEYFIKKKNDKIVLDRVQSLGRFNKMLETKWFGVLEELDKRIYGLVDNMGFDLPKVVVDFKNTSIESESMFKEGYNSLSWVSPQLYMNGMSLGYNMMGDLNF